ncbi:hypothetical protein HDU82_008625 [Entophlyctis luteolus]|nr:hypothetical protein HDU82_008625 [Entophlyctis luteolus]
MRRADIVIAAGTMASITLLQLIYLVSFILRKELPLKKKMLSPFNISLVSLLLSLLGQFLCEMSTFVVDHPSPYSYAILLTSLNHHVDQKFRIISKYGIACSAWAFMALTLFTIFGIFGDHMILVGVGITFSAMATLLVAMKVALFTEETAKTGSTLGISHLSPKGVIS